MKSKEEILEKFEPNAEYPSYYHESHVLTAMEDFADFKTQSIREALEEAVKSFQLIEQMSDPGSYERAVVEMKRIASGAVEKGKAALEKN